LRYGTKSGGLPNAKHTVPDSKVNYAASAVMVISGCLRVVFRTSAISPGNFSHTSGQRILRTGAIA